MLILSALSGFNAAMMQAERGRQIPRREEIENMYLISANDLYTVVRLIGRLPDRYIKNGNLYDGVYKELSKAELKSICSRGIKC